MPLRGWNFFLFTVAAGSLLLAVLLNLATLQNYPGWFVDEMVTVSRVVHLAEYGDATGIVDDNAATRTFNIPAKVLNLPYYIYNAPSGLTGERASIESVRIASFFSGLLLLAAVGGLAYSIWGLAEGICASLFCALSPVFIGASHVGRPDILAAAVGYCSLFFLRLQSRWLIPFGFASVVAIGIHERAVIIVAPAAVMFIAGLARDTDRMKSFYLSAFGAFLGLFPVVFTNVGSAARLQEWIQYYERIWSAGSIPASSSSPSVLLRYAAVFLNGFERQESVFFPSVLMLVAFFVLLYGKRVVDFYSALAGLMILVFGFTLVDGVLPSKLINFFPIFYLIVARVLVLSIRSIEADGFLLRNISKVGVVTIVSYGILHMYSLWALASNGVESTCRDDYESVKKEFATALGSSKRVVGNEMYALAIGDKFAGTWLQVKEHMLITHKSFTESIKEIEADTLVLDYMTHYLMDAPALVPSDENMRLPRSEILSLLSNASSSTFTYDSLCFGRTEVVHIGF